MQFAKANMGEFEVVPLAQFARGGRWRTESMRSYSRPVLIWFTRGQGRITISGNRRGYGAHNAIFLPAGTMHGFDMLGQVFGHLVFFPNEPDLGLPDEVLHLRLREARFQAELTGQIEQIARECSAKDGEHTRALPLLAGLLGVWIKRYRAEMDDAGNAKKSAAERLLSNFCDLVERDFRTAKGVSGYAAELGVTPTHLSRVCNQMLGKSALDFLAERRDYEARRLLRDTSVPVKEVAASLGFASAAYFTRAFAKRSGMTPSAFRTKPAGPGLQRAVGQ